MYKVSTFLITCLALLGVAMAQQHDAPLMVTGSGTVYGSPDVALLTLGVNANHESLEYALNDANNRVSAIRQVLMDNGLQLQDIRTTSFNIYPDERYDNNGNVTKTTFRVENILTIRVTDLTEVGQILTSSINAGANRVQRVEYSMSDSSAMQQEARRLAVANARAKAEELAGLAGVTLGTVTRISEVENSNYYGSVNEAMIMASSPRGGGGIDMDVPMSSGQLSVSTTVQMGFELE